MDDWENITWMEVQNEVNELYEDNLMGFCAGSKTWKYKDQYVQISVAKSEEFL